MISHDDVIYLVAPTGHPNFGDEYIAAAWLRTLARRRPRSRVVLDCPNPGVASVLHAGLHPRLTVTDTLFRLAEVARGEVSGEVSGGGGGVDGAGAETASTPASEVGPGFWAAAARRAEELAVDEGLLDAFAPHLIPGIGLLRAATVVHALGGGWINDLWPDKAVVIAAASAVVVASRAASRTEAAGSVPGESGASAAGAVAMAERPVRLLATGMGLAPAAGAGAGVGTAETAETMARVWARFDHVDVRDGTSEAIVRDALARGAGAFPDPAFPAPSLSFTGDDAWIVLTGDDLEDNGLGFGNGDGPDADNVGADSAAVDSVAAINVDVAPADRPVVLCLQGDLLAAAAADADAAANDADADPDPAGRLADAVVAALRTWTIGGRPIAGGDIAVVEAIPSVDRRVWRAIAERAPDLAAGARIVGFAELWHAGLPARAGQTWLTTRFHPHLIAAARGARGIALDVHVGGYYSIKHGSVVAAGSRWPVVSLDDVTSTPPGPGIPLDVAAANRQTKATMVEEIYPMGAVLEGAVTAAVKGRRALREVRGVVEKLAGTADE